MALSIKNPKTEALARQLADRTGTSVTGAITDALHQQMEQLDAADGQAAAERLERIRMIAADAATRWPKDGGADPSAWLYDDSGLPT